MEEYKLSVASSPHASSPVGTKHLMRDVLIALIPAMAMGIWVFGPRALTTTLVSVIFCEIFEWGYCKLMHKPNPCGDLSAAITGVLLVFVCPVTLPYWTIIIGDFFAIVVVKQLFGGIGKNFMNPALAARAFLFSWPALMTSWAPVGSRTPIFQSTQAAVDAVSSATNLGALHTGALPDASLMDAFVGNISGSMGETSALLLLIGGLYLVVRRVISPRIPLCFIGTVAVLTLLFPRGNDPLVWMGYQVLSGGLFLGAIFMATDYVTSPVTKWGQVIFAVGCGVLTVFIRYFGSYPEGVSYAILVMNACVVLLDKVGIPKRFGVVKEGGKKG